MCRQAPDLPSNIRLVAKMLHFDML